MWLQDAFYNITPPAQTTATWMVRKVSFDIWKPMMMMQKVSDVYMGLVINWIKRHGVIFYL